jgi:hypothetical protein
MDRRPPVERHGPSAPVRACASHARVRPGNHSPTCILPFLSPLCPQPPTPIRKPSFSSRRSGRNQPARDQEVRLHMEVTPDHNPRAAALNRSRPPSAARHHAAGQQLTVMHEPLQLADDPGCESAARLNRLLAHNLPSRVTESSPISPPLTLPSRAAVSRRCGEQSSSGSSDVGSPPSVIRHHTRSSQRPAASLDLREGAATHASARAAAADAAGMPAGGRQGRAAA